MHKKSFSFLSPLLSFAFKNQENNKDGELALRENKQVRDIQTSKRNIAFNKSFSLCTFVSLFVCVCVWG